MTDGIVRRSKNDPRIRPDGVTKRESSGTVRPVFFWYEPCPGRGHRRAPPDGRAELPDRGAKRYPQFSLYQCVVSDPGGSSDDPTVLNLGLIVALSKD